MDLHMLVEKSNEGDKKAKEEILEYFKPMINKIIKTVYINGCDNDDIYQMSVIAVLKAIEKIDLSKYQCVEGYIYSSIKNYLYSQRARSINTGTCLSLNYQDNKGENDEIIARLVGDCDVEEQCIFNDDIKKLKILIKDLTEEERNFLIEIYSYGYGGIMEYSKAYNKPYMQCYKMKKRLINNLKKSMENI